MATTPNVPRFNIKPVLGYLGWAIIYTAVIGGAGFYFGTQYVAGQQASTKAAVQDALKSQPAPTAVAEASK